MASPLVAGTAALVTALNPGLKAVDIAKRLATDSSTVCNTNFRKIDAAAAVADVVPPATVCN